MRLPMTRWADGDQTLKRLYVNDGVIVDDFNLDGWQNTLFAQPVYIPNGITIDSLVVYSQGGTDQQIARIGIYLDAGGKPGTLLKDCGVFDLATQGYLHISADQFVSPGWYWLAFVCAVPDNNGTPMLIAGFHDSPRNLTAYNLGLVEGIFTFTNENLGACSMLSDSTISATESLPSSLDDWRIAMGEEVETPLIAITVGE